MTRTLWSSFTAVLVVVAGTQPVYSQAAFDYKIFPGSFCQAQLPDRAAAFQRPGGYIFNMGTLDQPLVTCPIIRDRVPHYGRTDELTKIDAGIHFTYTPTIGKPVCWWISQDEWGNTIAMLPPTQVIDVSLSQVSMFWELPPIGPAGRPLMAIDGTYSISCQMPSLAFLWRYVVGEWDTTDHGF
jgi:hypothetical protein